MTPMKTLAFQAQTDDEAGHRVGPDRDVGPTIRPSKMARGCVKVMYQNDRVLRVMMVTDSVGAFGEWIDR